MCVARLKMHTSPSGFLPPSVWSFSAPSARNADEIGLFAGSLFVPGGSMMPLLASPWITWRMTLFPGSSGRSQSFSFTSPFAARGASLK
jgi:hypothetical protein